MKIKNVKEQKIKKAGYLILKVLMFTVICSCSSSRYTSFKSFVAGNSISKQKEALQVSEDIMPKMENGIFNGNETVQLAIVNEEEIFQENSKNPQKKLDAADFKKEKILNQEHWKDDYSKNRRKPFRLLEYDEAGLKYNKMWASIAISTGSIWIAGFLIAGVGTIMFLFFGASVFSALLSLIKKK
jgi:hypothetical protein